MQNSPGPADLLRWYVAMGADEAIAEQPIDRLTLPAASAPTPMPAPAMPRPTLAAMPGPGAAGARRLAAAATSLTELEAAVRAFDGCALKLTATNTVFADGAAGAEVMVIG